MPVKTQLLNKKINTSITWKIKEQISLQLKPKISLELDFFRDLTANNISEPEIGLKTNYTNYTNQT